MPRCPEEVETVHSVVALMEAAGEDMQKQLSAEAGRLGSLCSLRMSVDKYQRLGATTNQRAQADANGQAAGNLLRQVKGAAAQPGNSHEKLLAEAEAETSGASKYHLAEALKAVRLCTEKVAPRCGGRTDGARWDSTIDPGASLAAVLTAAQDTLLSRTDCGAVADTLQARPHTEKLSNRRARGLQEVRRAVGRPEPCVAHHGNRDAAPALTETRRGYLCGRLHLPPERPWGGRAGEDPMNRARARGRGRKRAGLEAAEVVTTSAEHEAS